MRVANLDDVELLHDALVKRQLLLLDLGNDIAAQVNSDEVEQVLVGLDVAFSTLDRVGHSADVVLVLKDSANGLFASVQILDVFLSGGLLLVKLLALTFDLGACLHSVLNSFEIVHLALDPVVEVDEWVAHVVDQMGELLLELGVLGGVEDEFLSVHLDVVRQV